MIHLELEDVKDYEGNKLIFSDIANNEMYITAIEVEGSEIILNLPKENIIEAWQHQRRN